MWIDHFSQLLASHDIKIYLLLYKFSSRQSGKLENCKSNVLITFHAPPGSQIFVIKTLLHDQEGLLYLPQTTVTVRSVFF